MTVIKLTLCFTIIIFFHFFIFKQFNKNNKYIYKAIFYNNKNCVHIYSTFIYFIIYASLFFIVLPISAGASVSIIPYKVTEVLSLLIIITGIQIGNLIANIFNKIILKKLPFKIYYIGENSRTWCLLIISLVYLMLSSTDARLDSVEKLTFSIIIGKLFWIDNKKNPFKRILKSFCMLPYPVAYFYLIILFGAYTGFVINVKTMSIILSIIISTFIFYIFIVIKYLPQIIEDITKTL